MNPFRIATVSFILFHASLASADPTSSRPEDSGDDDEPRGVHAVAEPEPAKSPLALRFSVMGLRDDGGYQMVVPTIGASHTLSTNVAVTASVGTTSFDSSYGNGKTSNARLFPVRLGLVGRSGPLALELGTTIIPYRENTSCAEGRAATWDSSEGIHGAIRVHVPVAATSRSLFVEGGAQMLLDNNHLSDCRTRLMAQEYAGWIGIGTSL